MDWTAKTQPIKPGDAVAYSKAFLQSTGQYTGDVPFARGVVQAIIPLSERTQLAEIEWGNPDLPNRVNVRNLVRVADLSREP